MVTHLAPFKPLPWQVEAWRDKSRILLLTGSAGGGKSTLAAEKMHALMMKYPGAVGVALRKTKENARKSCVFALLKASRDDPGVRWLKQDGIFEYQNGSRIFIAGMKDEQQREAIRSINGDGSLDFIWIEEATALQENDYQELLYRLRGDAAGWRQVILTTNPGPPLHWIKIRLMDGGEAGLHYSHAANNPHNPDDYLHTLESTTGVQRLRMVEGVWAQAEGLVFDNWSDELNVTAEAEYREGSQVWWAVDDGHVRGNGPGHQNYHPRVVLLMQDNHMGGVDVFYEYVATEEIFAVSLEKLKSLSYPHPMIAWVDSSASNIRLELAKAGISNNPASHRVADGIKFLRGLICDGHDMRLLRVHPRCTNLIFEMASYTYDPNFRPDGTSGEVKPLKINDHSIDALRYGVYWRRVIS
jgi:phage terminase large subunit